MNRNTFLLSSGGVSLLVLLQISQRLETILQFDFKNNSESQTVELSNDKI